MSENLTMGAVHDRLKRLFPPNEQEIFMVHMYERKGTKMIIAFGGGSGIGGKGSSWEGALDDCARCIKRSKGTDTHARVEASRSN